MCQQNLKWFPPWSTYANLRPWFRRPPVECENVERWFFARPNCAGRGRQIKFVNRFRCHGKGANIKTLTGLSLLNFPLLDAIRQLEAWGKFLTHKKRKYQENAREREIERERSSCWRLIGNFFFYDLSFVVGQILCHSVAEILWIPHNPHYPPILHHQMAPTNCPFHEKHWRKKRKKNYRILFSSLSDAFSLWLHCLCVA